MSTTRIIFIVVEWMAVGGLLGCIYHRDIDAASLFMLTMVYAATKQRAACE